MSGSLQISKRLGILQAITQQLQTITPANGYAYDLSTSVFRGRTKFADDTPLPCISILEAPQPGGTKEATEDETARSYRWPLLIQGWVKDDKVNPLDPAYYLLAAVTERLSRVIQVIGSSGLPAYPSEYRFGKPPLIMGMEIGPGICRPPDEISSRAYFFLPTKVEFFDNVADPWL